MLAPSTSKQWTKEEIETLRILANDYSIIEIAKIMNKTENAIYIKARKLNITLMHNKRKWTLEEEILLKDLWGNKKIEYISKTLKRSIFAIKVKAIRMNLGPMIDNNYDLITVSDISELLNVSRDRITKTWVDLGLNLKKTKLTDNKTYYTVTLKDLMKFLEENQNEWDSRNLEKNMLGLEPDG